MAGQAAWTLKLLDPLSARIGKGHVAKPMSAGAISDVPRGKATMANQQQGWLPGMGSSGAEGEEADRQRQEATRRATVMSCHHHPTSTVGP